MLPPTPPPTDNLQCKPYTPSIPLITYTVNPHPQWPTDNLECNPHPQWPTNNLQCNPPPQSPTDNLQSTSYPQYPTGNLPCTPPPRQNDNLQRKPHHKATLITYNVNPTSQGPTNNLQCKPSLHSAPLITYNATPDPKHSQKWILTKWQCQHWQPPQQSSEGPEQQNQSCYSLECISFIHIMFQITTADDQTATKNLETINQSIYQNSFSAMCRTKIHLEWGTVLRAFIIIPSRLSGFHLCM